MSLYTDYLSEIENRKKEGLKPKPIEDGILLKEIISQIKDHKNNHRKESINFLIYNTIPGTTSAAVEKSKFLKEIILEKVKVDEITPSFAFDDGNIGCIVIRPSLAIFTDSRSVNRRGGHLNMLCYTFNASNTVFSPLN